MAGAGTTTSSGDGHIMISYSWDHQSTAKKIRDELTKRNFKVWMDIDHVRGSILESMATAVEDAAVVLVCISRKYKESANCRTESEYALRLNKNVVPLMMEEGYRPDGWLGIFLGSKLYYDFSGKHPFQTTMNQLVRALERVTGQKTVKDSGDEDHAADDSPERGLSSRSADNAGPEAARKDRKQTPTTAGATAAGDLEGGYVMISYQWDQQDTVKKIRDALLKRNLRVWMDIDHMSGYIHKTIAKAIKGASAVLVCLSPEYEKSENCTMEFTFAVNKKKIVVPLKMTTYDFDDWIELMLKGRLYINFRPEDPFEAQIDRLVKELEAEGVRPQ